jgi:glycosyl transferase, family 25
MDSIDQIYYINLAHRTDRREHIEHWLRRTGVPSEKLTRIDATFIPGRGHLGCYTSHIKALEQFIASEHTIAMIMEDDYEPVDEEYFWPTIQNVFTDKINFDLIMCSYNLLEFEEAPATYLKKVLFSYTSSGYILTKDFAQTLCDVLKEGLAKCIDEEEKTGQKSHIYCLDVYWMPLMRVSEWFCFYPRLGKQYPSFSDIDGQFANHNV